MQISSWRGGLLDNLFEKGVSKKNLKKVAQNKIVLGFETRERAPKACQLYPKEKNNEKRALQEAVNWAPSYYKSMWSVNYPTTREEEKLIIESINSEWQNKKDNMVSYNCVTPIISIARLLFG